MHQEGGSFRDKPLQVIYRVMCERPAEHSSLVDMQMNQSGISTSNAFKQPKGKKGDIRR